MSVLVIAEHDQNNIKVQTQVAVAAAKAIGGDIHILVAGQNCQGAADAAAKVEGVQKVLLADHENYGHALAEELSNLIVSVAEGYSHILTVATTSGKNYMPRVAALLDVSQISEIVSVESEDTFKRPIYAGNAIATVATRLKYSPFAERPMTPSQPKAAVRRSKPLMRRLQWACHLGFVKMLSRWSDLN